MDNKSEHISSNYLDSTFNINCLSKLSINREQIYFKHNIIVICVICTCIIICTLQIGTCSNVKSKNNININSYEINHC